MWTQVRRSLPLCALALILLLGLLIRLPWLARDWRVSGDLGLYKEWIQTIQARGMIELYDGQAQLYPPLTTFLLGGVALIEQGVAAWFPTRESALHFIFKIPACLADVGTAALIAGAVWTRPKLAVIAAALYIFNPAVLYVSAFWAQLDSIYTFFLVAALVAFEKHRISLAWLNMALALGIKLQAIALAPILVPATLGRNGWRGLLKGVLILCGVCVILTMPWWLNGQLDSDFLRSLLFDSRDPRVDVSGFNVWYLIFRDGVHTASSLDPVPFLAINFRQVAFLLYGLYAAFIALRVWRKHQSDLALAAALSSLGLFLLPTEVHERFLFPVLALILLAAAQSALTSPSTVRTRWLWLAYFLFSITFGFNLVTIAQPNIVVPLNLIAAPTTSPFVALLKGLALGIAALNLFLFVGLTRLFWNAKSIPLCA